MNNKQKLKLFWKIIKSINKKICKNKIAISKIVFFMNISHKEKSCRVTQGYYNIHKKEIGIKNNLSLVQQIDNLCHELAHAYQHQILGNSGRHDKKGGNIYQKFLKGTDNIIKIR